MKSALLLAALAFSIGCRPSGPASSHAAVGAKASALRDAFNANADKPRVVALVSPS